MEEKILTPEQVALTLQVHPFTVLKFIKQGKLRASKLGRVYRIRESDVELFLDEQGANRTKGKSGEKRTPVMVEIVKEPIEETEEIDRSTVKGKDHYILN